MITKQEAKNISNQLKTSLMLQNRIYLGKAHQNVSLSFNEDADQYFDPSRNEIHLGIYGPMEIFNVSNTSDYISAMEYLYGHENQHVLSTATDPYVNGIKRAAQAIIRYIANKEGIVKNFRNDKDYDSFVAVVLPKNNIHIRIDQLMDICSGLANSVEDGRIERIRAVKYPGFEIQRRYFRAMFWEMNATLDDAPEYAKLTEEDKLHIHLCCILSLATTGLYPKGFITKYMKTKLVDELQQYMPYIGRGVLATRTRYMSDNVVEIAKILAPYLYEVVKKSDAEVALEKIIGAMMKQIASKMDPKKMSNTTERTEEEDDGTPCSVFPQSNLVITLDDETYDKLMEQAKKNKNSQNGGIMIRREHPKDENDQNDDKNSGSGSGSKQDDEKEANQSVSSASSQDENSSSDENAESKSNQDGNANDATDKSSATNQNSNGNDSSKEDKKSDSPNAQQQNENGNGSHMANGKNMSVTDDMVRKAMADAAQQCRDIAAETVADINTAIEHGSYTKGSVVNDADTPISGKDFKDVFKNANDFEEVKRKYPLDQRLPPVLNARAKAFRKKNERYFKSMRTPNVYNLSSGSINPSQIYGLAFGETDIFKKNGQDKNFDGCAYILIDNSGSMRGNKRNEACKAAAIVEEGFKGLFPFKIVAFDAGRTIIHEVIKGWNETQKLNCCWNFAVHGRTGYGNEDGLDIMVAQKELLARSEQKKMLIVLSDGAPGDIELTKRAIEETRKKGISVFGVYFENGRIGSDAKDFKYMYQKDYVCCPLSELDNALTRLMMKFSRS